MSVTVHAWKDGLVKIAFTNADRRRFRDLGGLSLFSAELYSEANARLKDRVTFFAGQCYLNESFERVSFTAEELEQIVHTFKKEAGA